MHEEILGDYRVIKQIGQGTLGSVMLAEHRFIKKHFVLKVLPKELCQDRNFIERFEEEVAKLAYLEHPHIVKLHTVSFADGFYFLVTDCVVDSIGETTNLAQYMAGRKERLREEELLSVLGQIASALDYAHTKGQVAHRALKLNNILIGKGKPGIDVFISDFGLSKIVGPGKVVLRTFLEVAEALQALPIDRGSEGRYAAHPIEGERLSKLSHSFLQTYAFLAPEQKHFEQVGMQADTYAFGILAYYLITGQFPEGAYEKPSRYADDYRHPWDELIEQCLQQDPTARPTQLVSLLEITTPKPRPVVEVKREVSPTLEQLKTTLIKQTPESLVPEKEFALAEVTCHESYYNLDDSNFGESKAVRRRAEGEGNLESWQDQAQSRASKDEASKPNNFRDRVLAPAIERVIEERESVMVAPPSPSSPPQMATQEESYAEQLNSLLNREPVVTHYHPEIKESKIIEPLQTEMVIIQGGEFYRGSNQGNRDEAPYHRVFLEPFALDVHPVTNEQFVRFLEFMGGEKDQQYNDLIRLKDSRINRSAGKLSIEPGYAKHPVVGVTWYGAVGYAKWVGKRLPTEAEWEIASLGGVENALYPTGENIEKSQANFFSSDTMKVMSYAPNGYGIYDMAGNVYEWCQDWYGYNYYETSEQEPQNPKGPIQGVYRVLRGGCWKSLKEDLRCTHRHRNNPGTVNSTYGFRCAANTRLSG